MRNILLLVILYSVEKGFAQTTTFDDLFANPWTGKSITWMSSAYGNGFGHRIVNSDPGSQTLLNFEGRNNSTTWTRIMSLTSDGKVGIGTTEPQAKLHVEISSPLGPNQGNYQILTRFQGQSYNNFKESTWIVRDANGTNWLTGRLHNAISIDNSFLTPNVDTKTWWERDPYNNIQSWGNSAETYMSLVNGKLGIGTNSPDSKLTVKGKIHAEEVKIDLAVPGADYVFKEDYKLMSLEDIRQFIKEHGQLPNVPSAKDMEENGVDLGTMNMKLLEKIEELTLYILMQNMEINELQKKNQELQTLSERVKKLESLSSKKTKTKTR